MKNKIGQPIEVQDGEAKLCLESEHFSIDDTEIDRELCQMGSLLLSYGRAEAVLRVKLERQETELKSFEAELDSCIRHEVKVSGEKITEAGIAHKIVRNEQRLSMLMDIRETRRAYETMRWATRALSAKRDCLIALAYRDKEVLRADRVR